MQKLAKLGEVIEKNSGSKNPTKEPNESFIYVDVAAIDNSEKSISRARSILGAEAPSRARKLICTGDILVSTVRPNLNAVALVPPDLNGQVASTGFCVLRATAKVLPEYLFFFVRSRKFIDGLSSLVAGAMYPAVTDSQVLDQSLPLPPIAEQHRIVDILSRAEGIVRLRRDAEKKAAELIPTLFYDMFGDSIGGKSKWLEVAFDETTTRITYGFTCPMTHIESGIPIVTAKNIINGQIDFANVHYAEEQQFLALTSKSKPNVGDILITKDGTIGRCAIVTTTQPFCINQSVALIQPKLDMVNPIYLIGYFMSPSVLNILLNMGKGQTIRHLQITELAKLSVPLPPLSLQDHFAERVAEVRSIQSQQSAATAKAQATFDALLAQVFT